MAHEGSIHIYLLGYEGFIILSEVAKIKRGTWQCDRRVDHIYEPNFNLQPCNRLCSLQLRSRQKMEDTSYDVIGHKR